MKVYTVLMNVTYHEDGESFDSSIKGVYMSRVDAEKKRDILKTEFEQKLENQKSEFDDYDFYDDERPECDVSVIEQEVQ